MSGIDEILQNIELDEDYCAPLTRAEQNRILHIINKKTGVMPKRKKHHIVRAALIAACVTVLIAATTALAVHYLDLEKPLGDILGVTEENFGEIENAIDAPLCSVTDGGYTVNILQTLADSRTIYAVFEVVAPEDVKMESWYEFEKCSFRPADWWESADKYGSFTMDISVAHASGNRMKCIAEAYGFTDELPDCEWTLELENISQRISYEPEREWNTIVKGKWSLTWDYSSAKNPETKHLSVNIPIDSTKRDIVITDITLSPISAQFDIRCALTESEAVQAAAGGRARLDIFSSIQPHISDANLSIKTKDGSVVDWQISEAFESAVVPEGESCMMYRYYMRYNNIIKMDKIESVIVNGREISIRDMLG